jgi:glycerol-3-phosphate dehydrogenase subunit B
MKTDALILGCELDGLVAALRLLKQGRSVRIIAAGGGSLHYAPDGLHLLGYEPGTGEAVVRDPYEAVDALDERHPLRLLGKARVRAAMRDFFDLSKDLGFEFRSNGRNMLAVSSAGQAVPVFAASLYQALFVDLEGRTVAVLCFEGHRDFPSGVTVTELRRRQIDAHLLRIEDPCGSPDSMRLASYFDSHGDPRAYFRSLRDRLPEDCTCALFPAVLGLDRHGEIMAAAEQALGLPCREIPTLPPSIPGMRLNRRLTMRVQKHGALLHLGAKAIGALARNGRCEAVLDESGRRFEAETFVIATGGVLMGGLEIDSHGLARDPLFGLEVAQSHPLEADNPEQALDALHEAGIETDGRLRPLAGGELAYENVFVTGRTLGHWNPPKESSVEGVAIASGWAAAQEACAYMEG